jgi:demethylmenaquinone methyltransferase/2-methoxy-6-polyprenyl-1,4-benzoquinol methylase
MFHQHRIRGGIPQLDFQRLTGFEVVALDEPQKCRVLIRDADHFQRLSYRTSQERIEVASGDGSIRVWNGVAVGVARWPAQHLIDAFDQAFGYNVFELLGFIVDLSPAHAHDLNQKELHEAMTAEDEPGELFTRGRQPDARIGLVLGKARFGQRLHHRGGGSWRHTERRSDEPHRNQALVPRKRGLPLINGFEVVFDRARREHLSNNISVRAEPDFPMPSVHQKISTPEGKRRYVRRLFTTIAGRYDFITVALSYGQDRKWKRRLIALAPGAGGARALDLATGTGDIAFELSTKGAQVVGLDVTPRMIELARAKSGSIPLAPRFLVGDMLALPFLPASFDLVTTGYGLRNVPDLTGAVEEIRRVLRPGGHLLSLDFNRPSNGIVRAAYLAYLTIVGGVLGWVLHRDPDTYRYIPASIRQYPGASAVVGLLQEHGFSRARYYPVLGGLMAMHHAVRD